MLLALTLRKAVSTHGHEQPLPADVKNHMVVAESRSRTQQELTIDWSFDKRWCVSNAFGIVRHVDRDFIGEFFTAVA